MKDCADDVYTAAPRTNNESASRQICATCTARPKLIPITTTPSSKYTVGITISPNSRMLWPVCCLDLLPDFIFPSRRRPGAARWQRFQPVGRTRVDRQRIPGDLECPRPVRPPNGVNPVVRVPGHRNFNDVSVCVCIRSPRHVGERDLVVIGDTDKVRVAGVQITH